ncbi:hypothetical protein [Ktedonobacter racemifer]|uniref:Uncharacterized protein n=1 Tax=Ktedonobacter racemifer DSM 44963 TaxID=485913 RepID=D6TIM8_KTERA|nr:hypothetical protein [Ktedonobacter racemifer]EFH89285.1 hypothetical protein Krac_10832 [Ktedonobacter racemifer DSM 44963]
MMEILPRVFLKSSIGALARWCNPRGEKVGSGQMHLRDMDHFQVEHIKLGPTMHLALDQQKCG